MKCRISCGVAVAICTLALLGCVRNIHNKDEFQFVSTDVGVKTLSIDAKQRVVLVARRGGENGYTVTCAEPSPDALTALSAAAGASAETAKAVANLSISQSESAASIGLRTQSIQLLRDGMYRLCEGYAAGAIGPAEYNRQQRRYQSLMLSLLAIEQLTGAVAAKQVGLGEGSSSASVGEKANDAAAALAQADEAVSTAETALNEAKGKQSTDATGCKEAPPVPGTCESKDANDTAVKEKSTELKEMKSKQETARQALRAARAAVTTQALGAHVNFSDGTTTSHVSDGTARYIAEATRTIVSTTLLASFAQEECTNVWSFLEALPPDSKKRVLERTGKEMTGTSQPAPSAALDENSAEFKALLPEEKTKRRQAAEEEREKVTFESQLVHMARNCASNQGELIKQSALFTPQYDSKLGAPLKVLGAEAGIKIGATESSAKRFVTGGAGGYQVSLSSSAASAVIDAVDGVFTLTVERAEGNKDKVAAKAFVMDSGGGLVEVPVTIDAMKGD